MCQGICNAKRQQCKFDRKKIWKDFGDRFLSSKNNKRISRKSGFVDPDDDFHGKDRSIRQKFDLRYRPITKTPARVAYCSHIL